MPSPVVTIVIWVEEELPQAEKALIEQCEQWSSHNGPASHLFEKAERCHQKEGIDLAGGEVEVRVVMVELVNMGGGSEVRGGERRGGDGGRVEVVKDQDLYEMRICEWKSRVQLVLD